MQNRAIYKKIDCIRIDANRKTVTVQIWIYDRDSANTRKTSILAFQAFGNHLAIFEFHISIVGCTF